MIIYRVYDDSTNNTHSYFEGEADAIRMRDMVREQWKSDDWQVEEVLVTPDTKGSRATIMEEHLVAIRDAYQRGNRHGVDNANPMLAAVIQCMIGWLEEDQ